MLIDEAVQISVHHAVDVAVFKACAVILDQRIGHEYIAADLAAPSDGVLHAFDITDFVPDARAL